MSTMTDDEIMAHAAERHREHGLPLTDGEARVIASQWHSGQLSALYSLASCGAIREDCADEIQHDIKYQHPGAAPELPALLVYVESHGVRPPVVGWSRLWG